MSRNAPYCGGEELRSSKRLKQVLRCVRMSLSPPLRSAFLLLLLLLLLSLLVSLPWAWSISFFLLTQLFLVTSGVLRGDSSIQGEFGDGYVQFAIAIISHSRQWKNTSPHWSSLTSNLRARHHLSSQKRPLAGQLGSIIVDYVAVTDLVILLSYPNTVEVRASNA